MDSGEKGLKNPKPFSLNLQTSFNRKQFVCHMCSLSACVDFKLTVPHGKCEIIWHITQEKLQAKSALGEKWRGVTVVIYHLPHRNSVSV